MKSISIKGSGFLLIAWSFAAFTTLTAQNCQYMGQATPGTSPVRFGTPAFLSTAEWFWHGVPAFSPDGTEVFFVKYIRDAHRTQIWYSTCVNGTWTAPQLAPFSGGAYSDNNPKFFGSKDILYFQSERPASAIYKVTRTVGLWSAPTVINLPIPAGKGLGKQFSLAKNGNIYAELDNAQGTDLDIYCWQRIEGVQYRNATRQTVLCSSLHDGFPTIDVNEQFIVYGSNRGGGQGRFDLYLSYKNHDGTWSQPENLGTGFNSGSEEAWSTFSADGLWFFYTTDRPGDLGFNPYWMDASAIYDRIPKRPYLGQVTPGLTPEKFAPEIVSSSGLREFSLTLSSDSSELYFYRFGENTPSKVYCSRFEQGSWSAPAEFAPSAAHPAAEPCITPDNRRLYFMWNMGADIHPYYMVERGRTGWSEPVLAGDGMYLTADQTGQLYTTDMSARITTGRTYLAAIETTRGVFTRLNRLDIQPNYGSQAHPCIAPDGSFILFDIDGGTHMFISFKKSNGSWDTGIDLTNHGFSHDAGGAYISPDGKYLFFHQNGDIWWVDIQVIESLNPFTGGTSAGLNPGFELYQNSPNPCNTQTLFSFSLNTPQTISLDLFSNTGTKITSLIKNRHYPSGKHEIACSLPNLKPGIYTYSIFLATGQSLSKKLMVAR